jgi:predicted amidohydrolase YtcJ
MLCTPSSRLPLSLTALVLVVACHTTPSSSASTGAADLIITDVSVWTGVADAPAASAVAIKGGVIVAVGTDDSVAGFRGPQTIVRSLPGTFAMPGLYDGHVHPLGAGRQHAGCSLQGLSTVDAILAKVRSCHEASAGDGFVSGRGFNLSLFPGANPHRRLLDGISSTRPIYFRGEDGHSGWANSTALARAGITNDTKTPEHGVIERDPDGVASGTLREDAMDLVEKLLPEPTLDSDVAALRWALHEINANGITSIMDAGVDERRLEAYAVLARNHELPVDVVGCVVVDPADPVAALALAQSLQQRFDGLPRLKVTATKIYLDGVLEGDTAALLQPYLNHADHQHTGNINATQANLDATVTALEGAGFQVHMHVIGDAAARAALDAYAASRANNGDHTLRGTLAHLQLVDSADHGRFKSLDIVANAQSYWAYPDTYILDINLPQVGQARVDRMYPWGSLARAGAHIAGGSDWPVSSLNPLDAIEVMVTRQDPSTNAGPVLNANEALSLDAALRAYTVEGAWLLHHEGRRGVIAVGAAADVAIFDRDLVKGSVGAINDASVVLTIKDGVVVYDKNMTGDVTAAR